MSLNWCPPAVSRFTGDMKNLLSLKLDMNRLLDLPDRIGELESLTELALFENMIDVSGLVYVYVRMYACVHTRVHVCVFVCFEHVHLLISVFVCPWRFAVDVHRHICMYVCTYIYVCKCIPASLQGCVFVFNPSRLFLPACSTFRTLTCWTWGEITSWTCLQP